MKKNRSGNVLFLEFVVKTVDSNQGCKVKLELYLEKKMIEF